MITFNELPEIINKIYTKVDRIEQLLSNYENNQAESDKWFNLEEFCKYHPSKPSLATVYRLVRLDKISYHKQGRRLIFLKSDIDAQIQAGRKKTLAETEAEADQYLIKPKGSKK